MDVKSKQLFLTAALVRSFRGSSDYTGALLSASPQGWFTLSGPRSWTPAPGPCQALRSCVCLKTRLNPPQQLSQIRLQFSAKGGGGRHRGLQVQTAEQMLRSLKVWRRSKWKKSGVEYSNWQR